MAELDELKLTYGALLLAYPWRRVDPLSWTPPRKPLAAARVALVSSAGYVLPGQDPFDPARAGGDTSFRVIPADAELAALREHQRSDAFDHAGIGADPNLALPLDRLRELAADGIVGAVAPRHLSFMGSITAPGRLVRDSAPAAARLLVDDGVDVALLVPV